MNDVAWSRTTRLFKKASGLLDPRVGRSMYNTFHAACPVMRWPLDYLFHSDDFPLVEVRRLENFGSDHFPFLVELALAGRTGATGSRNGEEVPASVERKEKALADSLKQAEVHTPGI